MRKLPREEPEHAVSLPQRNNVQDEPPPDLVAFPQRRNVTEITDRRFFLCKGRYEFSQFDYCGPGGDRRPRLSGRAKLDGQCVWSSGTIPKFTLLATPPRWPRQSSPQTELGGISGGWQARSVVRLPSWPDQRRNIPI